MEVIICDYERKHAETIKSALLDRGVIKEVFDFIDGARSIEMSMDDMFNVARSIVDRKLNIMIFRRDVGYMLAIDSKHFQQR